ncbi:16S rRNA (cytosine(1402)-N(4))-methyltransferase RsmH [Roseimicrobium sp. ORNL1]|uniref:16S rRNA (cytosine(1402)-N(4))-methyltransferase RsmH n=1 Tax=Roseimicrobium sp. ORNL1 TaxID=2711231 RepID=UPI001F1183A4|nr:16S rRNA (cytosine(1402)-N(4))-methyltransferase RsmH [Roseimicrobium sp. ORNL1]
MPVPLWRMIPRVRASLAAWGKGVVQEFTKGPEPWSWEMAALGACAMASMPSRHGYGQDSGGAAGLTENSSSFKASFDPLAYHAPVLPEEVIHYLQPAPGKIFLDCTLGGGGHSELLLAAGAEVIALDQDAEALAHARQRLQQYGPRFRAFQSNFRHFPTVLEEAGITAVDGILADLGVSSHQLDDAPRGFSFIREGPLDMRMNRDAGQTAADLVNHAEPGELVRILREYGEEHNAKRIVRAIVDRREQRPFETTLDLAQVIELVIPRRGKKTHPATLTFQALRLAVNEEMTVLDEFLAQAPQWVKPGGRIALISFHSGEDRPVKQAFARYSTEWLDRPEWPEPRRNPDFCMRLLSRKPIEATEAELKRNPRSRSAKLRVAERLPTSA